MQEVHMIFGTDRPEDSRRERTVDSQGPGKRGGAKSDSDNIFNNRRQMELEILGNRLGSGEQGGGGSRAGGIGSDAP